MWSPVGAIGDVDVAAIVDLHVVGLDRDLALLVGTFADTSLVGIRRRRRNVKYHVSFTLNGSRTSNARTPALKNVTNSTRP